MNRLPLLAFVALLGCQADGNSDIQPATTGTTPTETVPDDKPVVGLDLVGALAYQGTEITLFDASGGTSGDVDVPVIRNRDLLLRIFVDPIPEWEPRRVRAVLEVENNNGSEFYEEKIRIEGRSYRGQLETSFNFDIPGDQIKAATKFKVDLYEANASEERIGEELKTTWRSGSLDTEKSDVLKVVLVPIRYNADGSGRVPDTSQTQVDRYRDLLLSMYPVEDVIVEVAPVADWNQQIQPWNSGQWSDLLYALSDVRASANEDPNTYYYGLFNSEESFTTFCNNGCILGLSNLAWTASDPWYRTSIGIGFTGWNNVAATTLVHEVGHAHGRSHANCGGASGIDPSYPYAPEAIIGAWGYDTITGDIYSPDANHDMMGYCDPMWISDYTYYNLYLRIVTVGQVFRSDKIPYQTFRIDDQGQASLDKVREFVPDLDGQPVDVELLDNQGNVVSVVDGLYSPISHGYGGMVMTAPIDDVRVTDARVKVLER